MKYVCLGYIDPNKLENFTEEELHAMMDECFDYDDELRNKAGWLSYGSLCAYARAHRHRIDHSE